MWVRLYTSGLPPEISERRMLEIESDLWEHLVDPGTADREVLGRMLRGIHADVWWRYRTLLETRGARTRSHDMETTTRRNWWRPVTAVVAVLISAMGLLGVTLGQADGVGALALAAGVPLLGGILILAGLMTQRRHRVPGSVSVIVGAALAAIGEPFLIPVAAVVVIGGIWSGDLVTTERPDRPALDVRHESMSASWWRWIVAALPLVALGFVVLAVWPHVVPESCTELEPCWEDTAAWATWILSWLAAGVTASIGVVLGVLHVWNRHHTRLA